MSKLRYVKTAEELVLAAKFNPEFLPSSLRQIRAVYETDADIVAAVLPPPLRAASRPEVGVTISQVAIHFAPGFDVSILPFFILWIPAFSCFRFFVFS